MNRRFQRALALSLLATVGGVQARAGTGQPGSAQPGGRPDGAREDCGPGIRSLIAGLEDGKTLGLLQQKCIPEAQQSLAAMTECLRSDPSLAEASGKPPGEVLQELRSLTLRTRRATGFLQVAAVQDKLKKQYKAHKLSRTEWPPEDLCGPCAILWKSYHDVMESPGSPPEIRAGKPCLPLAAVSRAQEKARADTERLCRALRGAARLPLDTELARLRYYSWTPTAQSLIAFWEQSRSLELEALCPP